MRIIIIGAGPGGYETAVAAAKRGHEVIIVADGHLGGTCLNEGCIPTKTFINCATLPEALERKAAVVETLRSGVESLMGNKLITLVRGRAQFKDANTVTVEGVDYSGDKIIIATGSVSASLPIPGADLPGVITSREILDIQEVPQRLCVIGGGVIGLEFASIFRSFGSEVTVLEYAKDILPRFDTDLAKRLKQALGKRGIAIETAAQVTAVEEGAPYVVKYVKKDKEFSVECDKVLMAVGRRANVESLNLSDVGIEFSRRGIVVDDNMQTNIPGIYAVGDINGRMMLAHVATFQGIRALNHIDGKADCIRFDVVPSAVFTYPEAATVGLTEDAAKEQGIAVKCLKSFYRANGKAVSMNETDGFVKLIVAEDDHKILGCHMFGVHSSDVIQEITALINMGATIEQMQCIIHAHPTVCEVLQSAAASL